MKPEKIERVFGRGRVKMLTGDHVEVFREALVPGERRRYTKRFLETGDADFRHWTDREWRILARLIGHGVRCVANVAQYHGDAEGSVRQLQTYDAGISVDQWATLLPVSRNGATHRHVFEDCAHWWALAHHCLAALDEIHALQVVHLDLKADNICIPLSPASFDPDATSDRLNVVFDRLALIDFAFSLVSRDKLTTALPIGWQRDYHYQSPRLLRALEAGRAGDLAPTQELDWRCDLFSLAAMLQRFLSEEGPGDDANGGWTLERHDAACDLIQRLRECHDRELAPQRPHRELTELTSAHVAATDLARSLGLGWTLARDTQLAETPNMITPMTRIVLAPVSTTRLTLVRAPTTIAANSVPAVFHNPRSSPSISRFDIDAHVASSMPRKPRPKLPRFAGTGVAIASLAALGWIADPTGPFGDRIREALARLQLPSLLDRATTTNAPLTQADAGHMNGGPRHDAQSKTTTEATQAEQDPASEVAAASNTNSHAAGVRPDPRPAKTDAPSSEGVTSPAPEADGRTAGASAKVTDGPPPAETHPKSPDAREGPAAAPGQRPFVVAHGGQAAEKSVSASAPKKQAPRSTAASAPPRSASNASAQARSRAATTRQTASATRFSWASYDPPPRPNAADSSPISTETAAPAQGAADASTSAPVVAMAPASVPSTPTVAASNASTASPSPPSAAVGDIGNAPGAAPETTSRSKESTPRANVVHPAPRSTPPPTSSGSKAAAPDAWHAGLENLFRALGVVSRRAVPVEERNASSQRPAEASQKAATASRDSPASDNARVAASTHPVPLTPPVSVAQAVVPSAEAATPPAPSQPLSSALRPVPPPEVAPTSASTPSESPPALIQLPAPSGAPIDSRTALSADADSDLADRGRRILAVTVPRLAEQAQADASEALIMATTPEPQLNRQSLIDTTRASWRSERVYYVATDTPARARDLHDQARRAFASDRKADALDLELRAFAANPRNPDVAGFLAFLYLAQKPAQPETARQLALYALAISGAQRSARFDDWNTFAVASALTGRDLDARRAFMVELALSGDAERTCHAARRAYDVFGEPLRDSLEMVLYRLRSSRNVAACAWPTRMAAGPQ